MRVTLLLAGGLLAGCASEASSTLRLVEPIVVVGVTNVSASELERVGKYFDSEMPGKWQLRDGARVVEASAPRTGDRLQARWTVAMPSWEDLHELHTALTELKDEESGDRILANIELDAIVYYTSSRARAESHATVRIRVIPEKAALYFDTEMPEELGISPDRPVETTQGMFQFTPSFAFIRAHACLYFHSVYEGQFRCYEYDMEKQEQRPLPQIKTAAEFEAYRASK